MTTRYYDEETIRKFLEFYENEESVTERVKEIVKHLGY